MKFRSRSRSVYVAVKSDPYRSRFCSSFALLSLTLRQFLTNLLWLGGSKKLISWWKTSLSVAGLRNDWTCWTNDTDHETCTKRDMQMSQMTSSNHNYFSENIVHSAWGEVMNYPIAKVQRFVNFSFLRTAASRRYCFYGIYRRDFSSITYSTIANELRAVFITTIFFAYQFGSAIGHVDRFIRNSIS